MRSLLSSAATVKIPEIKRNSKWNKKADIGILVGYENVRYRILVNNKIIIARHVEFIGENESLVGFQGKNETDNFFFFFFLFIRIFTINSR